MRRRKRSKSQNGLQYIGRPVEMLESPAFAVLSRAAHQFLARLEIELAHHGGINDGRLPLPYGDLVHYSMSRNQIAPAMREVIALGFAECTRRGRGGNADHRRASLWRLTYPVPERDPDHHPSTHEWRRIKTLEEANRIAREARDAKDAKAVAFGQRRNRTQYKKSRPVSVLEKHTGTPSLPVLETQTTALGRKLIPQSISRGGRTASLGGRNLSNADPKIKSKDEIADS